jgi:hypothetical protein
MIDLDGPHERMSDLGGASAGLEFDDLHIEPATHYGGPGEHHLECSDDPFRGAPGGSGSPRPATPPRLGQLFAAMRVRDRGALRGAGIRLEFRTYAAVAAQASS